MSLDAIFEPLYKTCAAILAGIYSVVPVYGLAIAIFTILMMVIITPLTVKSTKSMLQMQRLSPQLKALQAKHKGDRERLNAEMMAFYKDNEISPFGGCLPLLAQSPVFFVMYRLLVGITYRVGGVGSGVGHIVSQTRQGVSPTRWIYESQHFQPEHLGSGSKLYEALVHDTKMNFLGMDISVSPISALRQGFVTFLPFLLLLLVVLALQIFQNRQIQARNPAAQSNPQQQMIMKFMPILLPIFALNLPAAMALYWGIQGVCRIATQSYITRRFFRDHQGEPGMAALQKQDRHANAGGSTETTGGKGSGGGKAGAATKSTPSGKAASKSGGGQPKSAKAGAKSPSSNSSARRGRKSGGGQRPSGRSSTEQTGTSDGRRSGDPRSSAPRTKGKQ